MVALRSACVRCLWLCLLAPVLMGQQNCGRFPIPGGNGVTPAVAALELSVFHMINQERQGAGLAPLTMDESIRGVARAHSEDMRDRSFFSHVNPDGLGPDARLTAAGIIWHGVAENIALNQGMSNPDVTAVQQWLGSPGHAANIFGPSYTRTGVGVAIAADGTHYFTQVFVSP